jgi:hypothetical protein
MKEALCLLGVNGFVQITHIGGISPEEISRETHV